MPNLIALLATEILFDLNLGKEDSTYLKHSSNRNALHFFMLSVISVTRLGDLLHFGQLFKAFGNN